jgi:membrane protein
MVAAPHPPADSKALLGVLIAGTLTIYGIVANQRHREATTQAIRGEAEDTHGRRAAWPSEIPKRGWRDILMRVKDDISQNNLSLIAAGAAFYGFLAIPSAIAALIALYGLAFDPGDVQRQVQSMQGLLPGEVVKLLSDQLQSLASRPASTLGVGLIVSVLIALWSARSGTSTMITVLNIAYKEPEKRNFIRLNAISLGLTFGAVVFAAIALALIAILPAIVDLLPFGSFGKTIASIVRWPILIVLVTVVLAAIYRFAPSRDEPNWRWVSWGATIATLLWILGSALFSIYVGKFASYDKSYGSLGAVVVLLMWLYLSAFVVSLGAELNAEIEHQTARDSTTGRPQPMGQRGAKVADSIGKVH